MPLKSRQAQNGKNKTIAAHRWLPRAPGLSPKAEKLPELKLQIDRREIGRAALDVPIPLDPETHALTAEAPGHRPWSTTITVNAETREVPP